jgi:PAS domain S-box-containing protein
MGKKQGHSLNQLLFHLVLWRLFLPLLAVSIIGICVVGYLGEQSIEKHQRQTTVSIAQVVAYYVDQAGRVLDALVRVSETSRPEDLVIFMHSTWESYRHFETLYYLDEDTRIKLMVPSDHRYLGLDMSNVPEFSRTDRDNLTVSRPFISLRTGNPTVYLIRRLANGGRLIGELSLAALQDELTREKSILPKESIFILDQLGKLLAHPSSNLVRQQTNLGHLKIFRRGLVGEATLVYNYAGVPVLASAAPIKRVGWVVVDQIPLSECLSPYAWIMGIGLSTLLAFWITLTLSLRKQLNRNVVAPLTQLSRATHALAIGDFKEVKSSTRVPATFDEVSTLSNDFLSMSSALQAREAALQESEERYRSLFSGVPVGIFRVELDGRILEANPALLLMLGWSSNVAFPDVMYADLWVSPEDYRMWVAKGKQSEIVSDFETQMRRFDGKIIWVRINSRATPSDERTILYCEGSLEDITERKRAEEAVRRANKDWEETFYAIPDMIMVLDTQHRILRANKAMADSLGLVEQELIGKFCFELVHDGNGPPAFCPHSLLLKDGKEHSMEVFEPKPGRSLDVRVSPLWDETSKLIGSVHVVRDITEQKNLQKQLLQAQKMESIGTLAGGIAHDFNNLLQIVFGYSEMLLFKKKPSDSEYEKLHAIRRAAQDGSELTKRILAFSRRLEPNSRPVNLNNEINRVEKILRRTIPRMIRIELHLADDLMTVNADPGQMEQILLNLAVNAQHAMPDGGILTIETANVTLDEDYARTHLDVYPGNYLLLTVSDTGHGMDKEVLEHIFDPFYTTKEPGVGTGLGLAMVFGIVKSHKGNISCYSEPGTGTTFKIYLPGIVQEIEQDVAATQEMPAFGTETILLVDDEDPIRKMGEQFLTESGYKVLTASNGREAIEVYRSNRDGIALVLLDLIMPEMGGKQCLEELLKINSKVKVVIASGYSVNGHTKNTVESGAKGFVSKPYDMRNLLGVVREVLDAE